MIYRYQAYGADRAVSRGMVDAVSEKAAEEALYKAGFMYVLKLKVTAPHKTLSQWLPSLFGIKARDIIDFSRQLASFLDSGTSLRVGLELLRDQATKPALKNTIVEMITRLEGGLSFSQVIKDYPQAFPSSYVQVIQSCEKAGDLVQGLNQVADYMEQRLTISDKIKRALAYPVFVLCLAIGVVILMVTTVLPPILKLFASFNTALPPVTLLALGLIHFLMTYKIQLAIVVILVAAGFWLMSRLPRGRYILDGWLLKIPLVGPLTLETSLGQFCRTTAMLITAGLALPSILEMAVKSAGRNLVLQQAFTRLRTRLMQGEGLAAPVFQEKIFPPMMARMIAVGEQTGTLDSAFQALAKYYEEHSNRRIESLIGLIEPAMTVGVGLIIAFIMLSIITPIYSIYGQVH